MSYKGRHGWSTLGIPGSLPWVAWRDNFGGFFIGHRGSPSGVPGAVFGKPGGPLRRGHGGSHRGGPGGYLGVGVSCHRCGRCVPFRRGRGRLLMVGCGEHVWEAQGNANLGDPGGPFHIACSGLMQRL